MLSRRRSTGSSLAEEPNDPKTRQSQLRREDGGTSGEVDASFFLVPFHGESLTSLLRSPLFFLSRPYIYQELKDEDLPRFRC